MTVGQTVYYIITMEAKDNELNLRISNSSEALRGVPNHAPVQLAVKP